MEMHADVVVIGAGAVGAAAAWRMAGAGLSVICVERGDWVAFDAIDRGGPDWELRRERGLSSNPNIRAHPGEDPVDDADSPIKPMFADAVGGTSVHWSAHIPRFRPEDFRVRSLDGVAEDWPISYDDLAPYYALNEDRWGLAAIPGDPAAPPHGERARRLPTIGAHGRRLAAAFDRLGWHWWPVDLAVGRDADEPGTVHCSHIGPCDLGCPSRVRSCAHHAYMIDAVAAGVRLVTRAKVLHLEHDAGNRVTAAVCDTPDGTVRLCGARFVVAGNGLNTPRLLLLSASGRFPDGMANSSGQLGRNLMLHPHAKVDAVFAGPVGAWARGEKAGIVSYEFYQTVPGREFVRGCKLQLGAGPPPAALANGAVTGTRLPWGRGHHRAFESRFDHICGLTVCAEDLPEAHNRIVLSPTMRDRHGLPAAKMIYRVSENSRRILDHGLDRGEQVFREAGAVATYRKALRDQAGFHLMGTARMGAVPETSVVDAFGQCHDVPNLFVVDGSVFVTSSAANPTATAQAFALRAADHIVATRRG